MKLNQFKITVLPLRDKLVNYAQRLTEDYSDAEDVVQEAMLKLWSIRDQLHKYHSIEALAMKITHNLCMDVWRKNRKTTVSIDQITLPHQSTMTADRFLETTDEMRLLREIIKSLPPLQQTILRMKDMEEYETTEIAEITGCNAEAIRSNLSRARKKVREIYLQTIQERKRRCEA